MIVRSILLMVFILILSACGSGSNSVAEPNIAEPNTPPVITNETFQQKLDHIVENSHIPGAVALLNSSDESWLAASGFAEVSNQESITEHTQMRIASMTKTLVAVTMLKLVEEGFFSLDDTIGQYLPEALNQGIANTNSATIRHLLAMTSGIINYTEVNAFYDAIDAAPQQQWTALQVLGFILDKPANNAAGVAWEYSNSNYVLCDIIVEGVVGASLASQMRRILFTPIGMDSTYVEIQENHSANNQSLTAHGYDGSDDVTHINDGSDDVTHINDGIGFGDGGVVSTVSDLGLFLTHVFRDKTVINEQSLLAMQAFHDTESYGLGLEKRAYNLGFAYAHSGGSSGFSGDMVYFPEQDITWVFLTNQFDDNDSDFGAFESLSTVLSQ